MMRRLGLQIAIWLLEPLVPKAEREAFIGDLVEDHSLRGVDASAWASLRWSARQVGGSAVPLLRLRLSRVRWLATLITALLAYVLAMTAMTVLVSEEAPLWLRATYFIAGPSAALLGAALRRWRTG